MTPRFTTEDVNRVLKGKGNTLVKACSNDPMIHDGSVRGDTR